MPVILATEKAEIRRITVQGQLRYKVSETPISTNEPGTAVHAGEPGYVGGIGRQITV
jgi:hypothetical protein